MIGLPRVYVSMSANGNYGIVFVYTPLAARGAGGGGPAGGGRGEGGGPATGGGWVR